MKKRLVLLALVLAAALYQGPSAQANCSIIGMPAAFAFETITVSSTGIGFTAATYAPATGPQAMMALITIETNAIRFRSDGTAPTAAIGHPVSAGSTIEVCGTANVRNFLMIRQSADASASVSYFR